MEKIHEVGVNCVSVRKLAGGRWHKPKGYLESFSERTILMRAVIKETHWGR